MLARNCLCEFPDRWFQDHPEREYYERLWRNVLLQGPDPKRRYTAPQPNPFVQQLIETIGRRLVVLDIGCGRGRNTHAIAASGHCVIGIDIATTALLIARNDLSTHERHTTFFVGASILAPPFAHSRFDLVLDDGCLHHIRRFAVFQYKQNVLRILADDGQLALVAFLSQGPQLNANTNHARRDTSSEGHYTAYYEPAKLEALLAPEFVLRQYTERTDETGKTFGQYIFRKTAYASS